MNEVEKMRSSQLADMSAPEVQVKFEYAKKLLASKTFVVIMLTFFCWSILFQKKRIFVHP